MNPPAGFTEHPLLRSRGLMFIGRADQPPILERFTAEVDGLRSNFHRITVAEALARALVLRREYVAGAVLDPTAMDIEVHALLHGYLRCVKARGGCILTDATVQSIAHNGDAWLTQTTAGEFRGRVVVNAAGAWSDELAAMAVARPIGLLSKRRTAILFKSPAGFDPRGWPSVFDSHPKVPRPSIIVKT